MKRDTGNLTGTGKGTGPAARPSNGLPVTLKDVAAAAGVSLQTVSYVVNGKGSISQAVRERVQEVADRMGYVPNKSAQAMRTGRSRTLALVSDDLTHPYWAEYSQAVERAAAAAGYAVLLIDAHNESSETIARIDSLRTHPVDGIITVLYTPAVARLKLPMVVISGAVRGRDSVVSDDAAGSAILAERLLQLGHRRFGLVTSPMVAGVPMRRKTLIDRLTEDGSIEWEYDTPPDERVGADVIPLFQRRDVTAIVCSNDVVAIGVLRVLRELGISVPGDVSVTGYDDVSWAGIVTPSLTTVRQPYVEAARKALELLIARIETPTRRARHVTLPVSLVERDSLGPVPT